MSVLSSLSANAGSEQDSVDSVAASPFVTNGTWRRVCFLLCPHCQYVEFPGCSTHSMLYSRVSHIHQPRDVITAGGEEEEDRRPAQSRTCMACAACNDSTETSAPFNTVCRGCQLERCKAVPVLLRESQLLACERAILAHQIAALVETAILHCSTCGAVEFPTIEGVEQLQQQQSASSTSSSSSIPVTSTLSPSKSPSKSTHGFLFNKYGDISDAKWILGEEEFDNHLREYEKQVREERLAVETSLRNEAQLAIQRMQEIDHTENSGTAATSSTTDASFSSPSSSSSDSTQPVDSSSSIPVSNSSIGPSSRPPAAPLPSASSTTSASTTAASSSTNSSPLATPLTFTALESERLAHRLFNLAKNKFWSLPHQHQHYFTSCTGKFDIVPVALSFSECNYLKKYYYNTPTPPLSHSLRLHEAVRRNDVKALEKLLKVSSFKQHINAIDQNQRTPLHYAAWYGRFRATELLLHHGANIHLKDNEGKTPFVYAIYWRHAAVVKLLLWSGAASTDEFRKDPSLLEQYIHKRPRGQPARGWTTADSTALPAHQETTSASAASPTTPTADAPMILNDATTIVSTSEAIVSESSSSSSSVNSSQLISQPLPATSVDFDQMFAANSSSASSSSSSVAFSAAEPSTTAGDVAPVAGSDDTATTATTTTTTTEGAAAETSPLIQFIQVFNEAAGGANAANGGWLVPNPLGAGLGGPPAQVLEHLASAEQNVFGSQALLDSKVDIERLIQVEQSKLAFLMGLHHSAGRDSALHNHFGNHNMFDRNLIGEIFHMLDPYSWHFLCAHSAAARHTHEMFGGCSASTNPHAVCLCAEAGGGGGGSAFGRPPPTSVIVQPDVTEDPSQETSTMKARRQHIYRPRRASVERTAPSTTAAASVPVDATTEPAPPAAAASADAVVALETEIEESKSSSSTAASSSSSSMPAAAAKYRIVDEKIHSFADKNIPFDVPWTSEHTSATSASSAASSSSAASIPVETSERKEENEALGATTDSSLSTASSHRSNSSYHALDVDEERKSSSASSSEVDAVNSITDPDILFLFSLVPIYSPRKVNLPTDLQPFVPQYYCPAELPRGSLDEMLKPAMPRSSSSSSSDIPDPLLGLAIVDEVNPRAQSNPEELLKKLKKEHAKAQRLKYSSSPSNSTPSPHGTPVKKGHSSRIVHSPNSPSINVLTAKKQVSFTSNTTSSPSPPKSSLRGEIFSLLSPFKGPSSRSPTKAAATAVTASSDEPTSNTTAAASSSSSSSSLPRLSDSAPPLTAESYQSLLAELHNKTEALNRISALVEARPESAAALSFSSTNEPLDGVDPPPSRTGHIVPSFRVPLSSLDQLHREADETEEPALTSTNVLSPQRAQIKLLPDESPLTSSNEEEEDEADQDEPGDEGEDNGIMLTNGEGGLSPDKSTPKFGRRAAPQQSGAHTTRVPSTSNGHTKFVHSRGNTTDRPRSRPMMNSTASSYTSVTEIITTKPKSGRRAMSVDTR